MAADGLSLIGWRYGLHYTPAVCAHHLIISIKNIYHSIVMSSESKRNVFHLYIVFIFSKKFFQYSQTAVDLFFVMTKH